MFVLSKQLYQEYKKGHKKAIKRETLANCYTYISSLDKTSAESKFYKYSNKHNLVKNPNWWQAEQFAIYKPGREGELGATENNIS